MHQSAFVRNGRYDQTNQKPSAFFESPHPAMGRRQGYYKKTNGVFEFSQHIEDTYVEDNGARHVYKTGYYTNGMQYSYMGMISGDEKVAAALTKMINAQFKESKYYDPEKPREPLKNRTAADYVPIINHGNRYNGNGGTIITVMQHISPHHVRAVGFAGMVVMNDDSDVGSGPEIFYKGKKDYSQQVNFISSGILNEWSKEGHADDLFYIRLKMFLAIGREYMVMKTNNDNLVAKNVTRGCVNLSENPDAFPDLSLVNTRPVTPRDEEIKVLVMTQAEAQKQVDAYDRAQAAKLEKAVEEARKMVDSDRREQILERLQQNSAGVVLPNLIIVGGHGHEPEESTAKQGKLVLA